MISHNALFLGTFEDKPYLPHLKAFFTGVTTYTYTEPVKYLAQLEAYCAKRNIKSIVSTNTDILSQLLARLGNHTSTAKLNDYAGSLFSFGPDSSIEIVFVNPLKQLFTVSYGKFLAARYISKVTAPESWPESTTFNWKVLKPGDFEEAHTVLRNSIAIAIDIETKRKNLAIDCVSYTAITQEGTQTYVFPLDSMYAYEWMRRFNATEPPKIFQNGKYDNAYFLRYNTPVFNWLGDTAYFFHSYYSELPKDLAFLNAFFLRKVVYWKDLAETSDRYEYFRYNGLDTWATANVFIQQVLSAPRYATHNYSLEFPLMFPCLLAELTGLIRDQDRLQETRSQLDTRIEEGTASLQRMLGAPGFNANSPKQVKNLLTVLGCGDLESTDEASLKKASFRHPLNARILTKILDIRGDRKLVGTYLRTDDDAKQTGIHAGEGGSKEYCGKVLYSLNPHATDTGRLASSESAFWCGFNIQNIPRGKEVKRTIRAPEGFFLAECDLEQAESRDTAHIAGDEALIAAVTGTRDFHSVNASAFFGRPYEEIYDQARGKTKDKKLRDLAKRVNHGANYNMGPQVLVETMGLPAIYEAAALLKLPFRDPMDIAEYLLCVFHKTYPKLKGPTQIKSRNVLQYLGILRNPQEKLFSAGTYYAYVAQEITLHKKLISRAFHHTPFNLANYKAKEYIELGDWTRYCFGKPAENKLDLNAYVAHCPQSLNARTLNEAFMQVFYKVALPNPDTFRLYAQIHDSILFAYKEGYEHHINQVQECMEIPVTVRDVSGNYRTFTVPAAAKAGIVQPDGSLKRAIYWDETE